MTRETVELLRQYLDEWDAPVQDATLKRSLRERLRAALATPPAAGGVVLMPRKLTPPLKQWIIEYFERYPATIPEPKATAWDFLHAYDSLLAHCATLPAGDVPADAVERVRRVIFELLVWYTSWSDVPFAELDRPRYSHLKYAVDHYYAQITSALPLRAAPALTVAEGYVLVPKVPTEAMITAGNHAIGPHVYGDGEHGIEADAAYEAYRAMLSAAVARGPQEGA